MVEQHVTNRIYAQAYERSLPGSACPMTRVRHFIAGSRVAKPTCVTTPLIGTRSERGQAALIWESPEAGVLRNLGVTKGDWVLIYMLMVPEAIETLRGQF